MIKIPNNDNIYVVRWGDPTSYEDDKIGKPLTNRCHCGRLVVKGNLVYIIHGWFDGDDDDKDFVVVHKKLITSITEANT